MTDPQTPEAPTPPEDEQTPQTPPEDAETFPREYVERLRRESAGYRDRAKRAHELAQALWTARVAATGRLADPDDLAYQEDALDDAEALTAAIDELLARKPHLASRRPTGEVGQGARPADPTTVDLAGLLRSRAG